MKKIALILNFLFLFFWVKAQVIPTNLQGDWELAQEHFHFTYPTTQFNIMDYGAVGNGTTDNSAALLSALAATQGGAGIIYFPAGEYLFTSPIILQDSIVLMGDGSDFTTLLFDFDHQNFNGINIVGYTSSLDVMIDSGYIKGSNKIYSDSAFIFSSGQMVEIDENNGSWDIVPASWATNSVGQMTVIDSIIGDTLILSSPLRIDYNSELNPKIRIVHPIINVGISCLKIKRLDEPENSGGYNINFSYAQNCRITGIESDSSSGSHVYIANSLNIRVTGSWFHHAFQYDGASTNGYGVTLNHRSSECIIENNIFQHLRHAMIVKTGANGNVIAYNYSIDPYRSEPVHDLSGDISLHGHYAYANLFESNIVQNIIIDHYWGPSGPFNTFFRNRAELWGIIMTENDLFETSMQNFVGNETTNSSSFHGQYLLTGTNHFEYGNNILNVVIPAGTDSLPDTSYYLSEKPPFWNISDNWPSIGLSNNLNTGTIPAKQRYLSGTNFTICSDSIVTHILYNKMSFLIIDVWPNPNNGTFYILANGNDDLKYYVALYNFFGQKVFETNLQKSIMQRITTNLPSGIYVILVKDKYTTTSTIIVIND